MKKPRPWSFGGFCTLWGGSGGGGHGSYEWYAYNMDAQREKELVALLNAYDVKGVPFNTAKAEILAKGFTEAELVYGLYSAPFDGKVNEPRVANPLHSFYEQHPEKADRLAKTLLLGQAKDDWGKTASYAAASQLAPSTHAQSYYEVRTADQLGIPYFALLFVGVLFLIIAISLDLPKQVTNTILLIYIIALGALSGYKLLRERQRIAKLRKELRKDDR